MPPTKGNLSDITKQKQLYNPFSSIRSHFTAINLLVTTDIREQLKDGEKGLRCQIKLYSETKPSQREAGVKIMESSISAQFKLCVGDIPITRTTGEKKSRFSMQERFITLLAFDNLITSSCLAV